MDDELNPESVPTEPEETTEAPTEDTTEATEAPTEGATEGETEGATEEGTEEVTEEATEDTTEETIEETSSDTETTAFTETPGPGPDPILFNWLTWSLMGLSLALTVTAAVLAVLLRKKKTPKESKARRKAKAVVPPAATAEVPVTVGKLHQLGDRDSQQDCFAVSPENLAPTHGLLAVVADGMGGLADGDKVSQTVVGTMLNGFMTVMGDPDSILLSLTMQANQAVNRLLGPAKIGRSGSTLVAGILRNDRFHYVSVGDSRICLYRNGRLLQLNREHIYKNDLTVEAINGIGLLYEAATNRNAGGLTSYLGMGHLKYVDIPAQAVPTEPGDKFILMTDGVYNALTEEELCQALNAPAQQAADIIGKKIRDKAYAHQDNYTAVILSC